MRKWIVVVIALPAALAFSEAVAFLVHNRTNGTIDGREYLLHVPRSYNAAKPVPLVVSLHGAGGWPVQQMETSRWNDLADREAFIVVYPAGAEDGGPRVWRLDDSRYIGHVIDGVESRYNIDRNRIYADGFSNGGGMAFILSCRLAGRIAAVGLVAAAQSFRWSACGDAHAVPAILIHGSADPVVPYNGGESWLSPRPFPSVPMWAENWATRNRCTSRVESAVARDVTLREYRGCSDNATVALYTIRGGGHVWPGGEPLPEFLVGPQNDSIDATSVMWRFFLAHPLPTH